MAIVKFEITEDKIIVIRGEQVLLDSDVGELYGVETKRINEAVKNNPDRFPSGYVIELNDEEKNELVENFDRFNKLKHSSANPKAFTEKGLYMLATIVDEARLRQARPDYVVILPWNLREEVVGQLAYIREWGGQFVTAVPNIKIA